MRASGFSVSVTKKRKKKCIITCNSQCWKALTEWRGFSSLLSPNHRKTGENYCVKCRRTFQSPVHWDSVNHWINLHPLDNAIGFRNTYALNSGLSGEWRYPSIEQRGPGVEFNIQVQKTVQKEKEYFVVACLHPTEKENVGILTS